MVFFVECAKCNGKGAIRIGWVINRTLLCPDCGGSGSIQVRSPWRAAPTKDATESPSQSQVGGDHYRNMKIQPVEFITANSIPYLEGNVIKYICRHRSKGGAEDLKKAKHYIDLLLQHEYQENGNG